MPLSENSRSAASRIRCFVASGSRVVTLPPLRRVPSDGSASGVTVEFGPRRRPDGAERGDGGSAAASSACAVGVMRRENGLDWSAPGYAIAVPRRRSPSPPCSCRSATGSGRQPRPGPGARRRARGRGRRTWRRSAGRDRVGARVRLLPHRAVPLACRSTAPTTSRPRSLLLVIGLVVGEIVVRARRTRGAHATARTSSRASRTCPSSSRPARRSTTSSRRSRPGSSRSSFCVTAGSSPSNVPRAERDRRVVRPMPRLERSGRSPVPAIGGSSTAAWRSHPRWSWWSRDRDGAEDGSCWRRTSGHRSCSSTGPSRWCWRISWAPRWRDRPPTEAPGRPRPRSRPPRRARRPGRVPGDGREAGGGGARLVGGEREALREQLEAGHQHTAGAQALGQVRHHRGLGAGGDEDHHVARHHHRVERSRHVVGREARPGRPGARPPAAPWPGRGRAAAGRGRRRPRRRRARRGGSRPGRCHSPRRAPARRPAGVPRDPGEEPLDQVGLAVHLVAGRREARPALVVRLGAEVDCAAARSTTRCSSPVRTIAQIRTALPNVQSQ